MTSSVNPYLEEEGRITRSFRLMGDAWWVIRRDRAMLVLAAISAAANIAGVLLLFKLAGWHAGERPPQGGRVVLATAIAAYPLTFLSVFLNVAIAAAAGEALQGRKLGVLDALGVAASRLGQIALWAALATGVGLLLQELASRLPAGGGLPGVRVGGAGGLVSVFLFLTFVV